MKALEEWLLRNLIYSQTRAFPIDDAFLATLSQGSRREVADQLRRAAAIGRLDALKALRVAWTADRVIPRAIVEDRETPPARCIDSLALDFTLVPGQRPNVMLRGSAVAEVYLLGEAMVADRLFELLDHPRTSVRAGAANFCAVLSEEAKPTRFASITQFEQDVWGLPKLQNAHWLPHVAAALRHPNVGVRLAAASALGRLRPRGAVGLLVEATEDDSGDVRIAALTSLGALGDPTSLSKLMGLLSHHSVFSRIGAARGLTRLSTSDAVADPVPVVLSLQERLVAARQAADASEANELEHALRTIARDAGIDLRELFPASTLPIPSLSQAPDSRSLPVADGEPS